MRIDGLQPSVDLLRDGVRPDHGGDRRSVDVGVEQADFGAGFAQRRGHVDGDSGFTHTAFPRRNGDRLLDAGQDLGWLGPHECRSHVGGHTDVDPGNARNVTDEILGLGLEAIAHRARRRGQFEGEGHLALRADLQLLDHAEADHVPTQVRVLYVGQDVEHLLASRAHGLDVTGHWDRTM